MDDMTKKTREMLTAICDTMAGGVLSPYNAAKRCGVSSKGMWLWIRASQRDDPDFIIEYLGEEIQFARALVVARRIALHEARGRMEERAIMGHDEPIFYQGNPTWKIDPRTVGIKDDLLELLGLPTDRLLRDRYGNAIQNTVHHLPPVALALRVSEM